MPDCHETTPWQWLWKRAAGLALVAYWLLLFGATHWPQPPDLSDLPGSDKTLHLTAYALLAFLLACTLAGRRPLTLATAAIVLAIIAVYGATDELTQPFFGRSAELSDWAADMTGAMLGLLAARYSPRLAA
jgi:VanZ family protein